jgi:cell division ATPase FtsA
MNTYWHIMAQEAPDYSQIYEFLYRIERRINYLENDAAFIKKKIETLEENKNMDFRFMDEELNGLRISVTSIKNNFLQCVHGMTRISKDLKDTIKKEDLQNLSTQMEEIKFEEFVTLKDLERGV